MVVALAAGCGEANGDRARPDAPAPRRLSAKTECIRSADAFAFHVLLEVDYTKSSLGAYRSRQMYSVTCRKDEKTCDGAQLRLDNADKGQPLGFFDLGSVSGARVTAGVGDVYTVQWGPLRQFVVDFGAGMVTFTESNDYTYGRGMVRCP